MKKIIAFLLCITLLFLSSCTDKSFLRCQPYCSPHSVSMYNVGDENAIKAEVTTSHQELVTQIYQELAEKYNISKPIPEIGYYYTTNGQIVSQYSNGCIYISPDINKETNSSIAHELTHYFSDDGEFIGFRYSDPFDELLLGASLDEGVCNYISNKYVANTYYAFETLVASVIALCYGEEKLINDFFSSNVYSLRDDFNNCLKGHYGNARFNHYSFSPFDVFVSSLDTCGEPGIDDTIKILQMYVVTDFISVYAEEKGKTVEVRNSIQEFINTYKDEYPYFINLLPN